MSSMVTVFGKGDEALKSLWEKRSSKSSVDVTLICIGDYMYCHRKPLIEASPKFKRMLLGCPSVLNLGVKPHEALFLLNVVYGLTFSFPSDLMPKFFSLLNEYEIPHPPVHVSTGPLINADAGSSSLARIAKLINQENRRNEFNVVKSVNMARKVSRSSSVVKKAFRASEVGSKTYSGLVGNSADGQTMDMEAKSRNYGKGMFNEPKKSPVAKKLLPSFTQLARENFPSSLLRPNLYEHSLMSKTLEDLYYEGDLLMDNSTEWPQKTGRAVSSLFQKEIVGCVPDQYLLGKVQVMSSNDKHLRKGMHFSDRDLYGEKVSSNGTYKAVGSVTSDSLLHREMAKCLPDKCLLAKRKILSSTDKHSRKEVRKSDRFLQEENYSFNEQHRAVGSSCFLQTAIAERFPDQRLLTKGKERLLTKRKVTSSSENPLSKGMQTSDSNPIGDKDSVNGESFHKERVKTRISSEFHRGNMGRQNFCFFNNCPRSCIWCPLEVDKVSSYSCEYGSKCRVNSSRDCTDSLSSTFFDGDMFMKSFTCDGDPTYSDNLKRAGESSIYLSGGRTKRSSNPWYCNILENELKLLGAGSPASREDVWHQNDPINATPVDRIRRFFFDGELSPPDFNASKKNSTELVEGIRTICQPEDGVCEDRDDKMDEKMEDSDEKMEDRDDKMATMMEDRADKMADKMAGEMATMMEDRAYRMASKVKDSAGQMATMMDDRADKMACKMATMMEDRAGEISAMMEDRASKMEHRAGIEANKMEDCASELEGSSKDHVAAISSEELDLETLLADQTHEEEDEELILAFRSPRSGKSSEFTMDHLHEDTNAFEKWWKCENQYRELADSKLGKFEYAKCPSLDDLRMFKEWESRTDMMLNSVF